MLAPVNAPLVINLHLSDSGKFVEILRMLLTRVTLPPDLGLCTVLDQTASSPEVLTEPELAVAVAAESLGSELDLQELFDKHVLPVLQIEVKTSTISGYRTAVKHFCEWWRKTTLRSRGPKVKELDESPQCLGEFYKFGLQTQAEKSANNKLKYLRTVWTKLHLDGLLSRPAPNPRTRQIRKQCKVSRSHHVPIPASETEISAMLDAVIQLADVLEWPRLGPIEPFTFWWNVLASCCVHGFRRGDIWPVEKREGKGLLWSEVSLDPSPPIDGGEASRLQADWEFGWLCLTINKTGGNLVAPISPHFAWLIQQCRGLDPERVFPLTYDRTKWYGQIRLIKKTAGLDRDVSLCGQAPSASLRKTCSVIWKRHAGRPAASHMLGHSVRSAGSDDVFSDVTEKHYMGADTLREVVQGFPAVLAALPHQIRC